MLAIVVATVAWCVPGTAWATTWTGSANDEQGTLVDASTGQELPDVKSVTVTYNDATGELGVDVGFWKAPSVPYLFDASLGIPVSGRCAAGQEDVQLHLDQDYWEAWLSFRASSGYVSSVEGPFGMSDDATHATGTFVNPALVRLGLRCLSNITLSTFYDTVSDTVSAFCLGPPGCFTPPPPLDQTGPNVGWLKPAAGTTISGVLTEKKGNCLVAASDSSGIDHTENYVDGRLNDRQVNAPWSCELDTTLLSNGVHTLTVKAFDKAGNSAQSTISVIVKNDTLQPPRPPDVLSPPPGPPGPPSGGGGGPSPQPVVTPVTPGGVGGASGPTAAASGLTLSLAEAKRAAGSALRSKYRGYRRGRARRTSCTTVSATQRLCTVTWRYNHQRFRRSVLVTKLESGYRTKVS